MYRRFLNNNDYLSIITEQALTQLIRGNEMRYEQAEQAAEASVVDYLSENYEIEKELNKGKYLFAYNRKITYPVGSHFYLDGKIALISMTARIKSSAAAVIMTTLPLISPIYGA